MNDFKKNKSFGGRGGGFGKKEFKRPSFGGKSFGDSKEMFEATCASCAKVCEVPFRPNGKKPVYCKNCFAANGGPSTDTRDSRSFAPRREYDRPAYKPEARFGQAHTDAPRGNDDLKKQMEMVNAKLDTLIQILSKRDRETKDSDNSSEFKAEIKKPAKKKATPKKS